MPEAVSWGFFPKRGDTLYVHDPNQEAGGMLFLGAGSGLTPRVQRPACGCWILGLVGEVTRLDSMWASVMYFLCHDARQEFGRAS